MTKLSRKLLISVFTLAFALVTLGATTFAWFTLSTFADIDAINVTVTSGEGIELSTNGNTYKNNIDISDILTQITSFPIFDPVTSPDGSSIENIEGVAEAKNGKYLSFNLWVRSPSKDGLVYLLGGESGTNINSEAKSWKPDTDFTYTKYGPISQSTPIEVYGANSVRFSFEEYSSGTFETKKDDGLLKVFELNPVNADALAKNTLLGTTIPSTTEQGLVNYWANKKIGDTTLTSKLTPTIPDPDNPEDPDIDNPDLLVLPGTVYHNESLGLDEATNKPKQKISDLSLYTESTEDEDVSIDGFYYGYLTVRVWIEGWDPDNFDAILGTPITVVFKFGVVAA